MMLEFNSDMFRPIVGARLIKDEALKEKELKAQDGMQDKPQISEEKVLHLNTISEVSQIPNGPSAK